MSVPDNVPANVPAGAATPAKRKRMRASRARNDGSAPFLTRTGDGWQARPRSAAAAGFRRPDGKTGRPQFPAAMTRAIILVRETPSLRTAKKCAMPISVRSCMLQSN